jgi:hypothetical protein
MACLLALAGLAAAAIAPVAAEGAKPAVTRSSSVAIGPGTQQSAKARCPKGRHMSGGGFTVAPTFNPAANSGTATVNLISHPAGRRSWQSGGAAFTTPSTAGTFTTIARCERNSLGQIDKILTGSSTIPVSQSTTVELNCPRGTHALTAGYAGSPAGSLTNKSAFRLQIVQSRRTTGRQWTIIAVNPAGAPGPASLTTNVACEVNRKGGSVSEKSSLAAIANNGRTSSTASCTGKKHVVGGGFSVLPAVGPAVSIDQTQPVGKKSWQIGLYEFPGITLPAGSTLTTYAYCKKN